jgi:hypothetical protein
MMETQRTEITMTSKAKIEAAAQAIFQTLESKHGAPLSSIDVQRQDAYRIAASVALHAAERLQ